MPESNPPKPAVPPSASDMELQHAKQELREVEMVVIHASENGLFAQSDLHYKNKIDDAILRADAALNEQKRLEASAATYEAQRYLDEAWNAAPKKWLAFFELGWMHHLFTFIGAGMATMVLWAIWQEDDFCNIHLCSALFGMLGALVRCLYWTTFQANRRTLRRVWVVQNFFAPLVGLILGCVADFVLRSGLIIVTQGKTEPNPYASGVLAFYAGFNWEWILSLLRKFASQIKTKSNDSKDSSSK
jgi:hypothetical protein